MDDQGVGSIYLDLKFLKVEPLVVSDVSEVMKAVGQAFGINWKKLLGDDTANNAAPQNAAGEESIIASQVFFAINTQKKQDFFVGSVTSSAFYAIMIAMGVVNIERYFGEVPEDFDPTSDFYYIYPRYSPTINLSMGSWDEDSETYKLINLEVRMKDFLTITIGVNNPTIDIARGSQKITIREKIKDSSGQYVDYYTPIDQVWINNPEIKLNLEGQILFDALGADSAEEGQETTVNFGDLLRELVRDDFPIDVLLETLNSIDADLYFTFEVKINILKMYQTLSKLGQSDGSVSSILNLIGGIGLEAYFEIDSREHDANGLIIENNVLAGIYLVEEKSGSSTYLSLYVDLSLFHISPVKITDLATTGEQFFERIGDIFAGNASNGYGAATEEDLKWDMLYLYTDMRASEKAEALNAAAQNAGSSLYDIDRASAVENYLSLMLGNNYGLTMTAVAEVLIEILDEIFNDDRSIIIYND